jgi:type IV secretion system protein VirB3
MSDKTLYPSYAGLGRTAMIWGVPLIPTLFVFAAAVFAALLGAATMGPGGLLFAVPSIPVFLFFKRHRRPGAAHLAARSLVRARPLARALLR